MYLVLDLEMCKIPRRNRVKSYPYQTEIIQIGAVLLNERFERVGSFSSYVRPVFGCIDSFIENLTGITQRQIEGAPLISDVLRSLAAWCAGKEVKAVSWSLSDLWQLKKELKFKGIEDAFADGLYEDWIDAQKLFGEKVGLIRAVALEEALNVSGIVPEGRLHDGLEDAENTAVLYARLMSEEEFCWQKDYLTAMESEVDHLNFAMGELFAGIGLELPA